MECAYKKVRNQEKLVEICERYGGWFLEFADYSLTLILHDEDGFGARKRLPDLFDGMNPRLNERMRSLVEDDNEDLWETTQNTYYNTIIRLQSLAGFDPRTVTDDIPVRDLFKPIRHSQKEADRHIFRRNFVDTMEKKIGVYYNMVLLYLAEEYGWGAVKLERRFRRMRQEYVKYAELFLMTSDAKDREMHRMVEALKGRAAKIGIQYEYGGESVPDRKCVLSETNAKGSLSRTGRPGIPYGGMVCQNQGIDVSGYPGLPGVSIGNACGRIREHHAVHDISAEISGRSGQAG